MNAFEVVGRYVLEGADAAAREVSRVADMARQSADRLQAVGARVTEVGEATKSFGDGMTKYVSGGLIAAGAGLFALAESTANWSDSILDLADATGLSTDEVQRWQLVAQAAGVSSNAMLMGLDRLQRQMGNLKNGTSEGSLAMQQLGIDTERFFQADPAQRTRILAEAFGRIEDPARRAALGTALFSRRWFDIAPILGMGATEIERVIAANEQYVISNDSLAKAGYDYRNQLNEVNNALTAFRRELGLAFIDVMQGQIIPFLQSDAIPMFREITQNVIGMFEAFRELPEPLQQTIIKGTLLAAALGPVISLAGRLFTGVGGLISFIGTLAGVFGVAAGAVSALAGPVIAVIAVVGAAIYIFKNWEEIVEALGNMWDWLTEKAKGFASWLADAFVDVLADVIASAILFGNEIQQRLEETWDGAMAAVRNFAGSVVEWFRSLPGQVVDAIRALPSAVWDVLKNMGRGMVNIVKGAIDNVIQRFRNMYRAIVGNSIVPDMRVGVQAEMEGMADESEASSARLARSVAGNFTDVAGSANRMGAAIGTGQGNNGSGGNTVIDMRHSILRDDRDLVDRLRRMGIGTLGGLV